MTSKTLGTARMMDPSTEREIHTTSNPKICWVIIASIVTVQTLLREATAELGPAYPITAAEIDRILPVASVIPERIPKSRN